MDIAPAEAEPAGIYRALAEHTRREVYPDVVARAEAEFTELQVRA
ncbi:hypothetical protein [Streptosporangium amethystogenes]|nr:hypothetical protein [Streptosporangium amethystogenes]